MRTRKAVRANLSLVERWIHDDLRRGGGLLISGPRAISRKFRVDAEIGKCRSFGGALRSESGRELAGVARAEAGWMVPRNRLVVQVAGIGSETDLASQNRSRLFGSGRGQRQGRNSPSRR